MPFNPNVVEANRGKIDLAKSFISSTQVDVPFVGPLGKLGSESVQHQRVYSY